MSTAGSKRILIISDNEELAQLFLDNFKRAEISALGRAELRYSAINKSPSRLIALGATSADLTAEADIRAITSQFDLVISAHCKKIFPPALVHAVRCVNFHPGFNPFNRGWYPQAFSILNGAPLGVTVHEMTVEVDGGPIIAQERVHLEEHDTSLTAYRKVIEAEKSLIRVHLAKVITGDYRTLLPVEGNYNSIADYRALCRLDMERMGTLREHIDLLRALSHPPFKNAYFLNSAGEKVFVGLSLEKPEN